VAFPGGVGARGGPEKLIKIATGQRRRRLRHEAAAAAARCSIALLSRRPSVSLLSESPSPMFTRVLAVRYERSRGAGPCRHELGPLPPIPACEGESERAGGPKLVAHAGRGMRRRLRPQARRGSHDAAGERRRPRVQGRAGRTPDGRGVEAVVPGAGQLRNRDRASTRRPLLAVIVASTRCRTTSLDPFVRSSFSL
jgi:hypothetical protein